MEEPHTWEISVCSTMRNGIADRSVEGGSWFLPKSAEAQEAAVVGTPATLSRGQNQPAWISDTAL